MRGVRSSGHTATVTSLDASPTTGAATADDAAPDLATAIAAASADAGADVFAHAIDIDSGAGVGVRADDPVVTASVFKVPVLTEYVRQVSAGDLDPASRVLIRSGSATMGPTGLSVFSDDADWSLRDVATSMITVSDNAATDIVTGMVGVDRVNATMAELGLPGTVLIGDCRVLFDSMADDYGVTDPDLVDELMSADPARIASLSVCTPTLTNRSTPRECARLLQLLWTDRAADPAGCAEARRILGLQVWPHRLSSGFPTDDVRISGKTGTIGIVRNEIGVVEFPDGHRYAVAVFTRSHRFGYRQPKVDALIGTVAAALVGRLARS
ncbi:MAG: serine hydrolase [Actinobacteria bacterium]|nr:serine hydrolase [Actinomycetota bacterium]